MRTYLSDYKQLKDIAVDSAGLQQFHAGDAPDPRTMEVLRRNQISTSHQARVISANDFSHFKYIFTMDNNIHNEVLRRKPSDSICEVKLFRDFDPKPADHQVADPYYGTITDFENCFSILERCCLSFIEFLKTQ